MNYSLVDPQEAPARPETRQRAWTDEITGLVNALGDGKVARIEATDDEKLGALRNRTLQQAARLGKRIEIWEADGALYAELLSDEMAGSA